MCFPLLPAAGVFLGALVIYLLSYYGIEHLRRHKGPWKLEFKTDGAGLPSLVIHQPSLGIQGVELIFTGEQHTNANWSQPISLDRPVVPLPFGRRLAEDLTFQPGTLAMDLFGHEIEIAPRVMVINRREVAWVTNQVIRLKPAEKLPPEELLPKPRRPLPTTNSVR